MGKFITRNVPTEATYVFEFTQSEVDVLGGIVADLLDNPQRKVHLDYVVDGDYVKPSELGMDKLMGCAQAFNRVDQSEDYDYFDYWETAERD